MGNIIGAKKFSQSTKILKSFLCSSMYFLNKSLNTLVYLSVSMTFKTLLYSRFDSNSEFNSSTFSNKPSLKTCFFFLKRLKHEELLLSHFLILADMFELKSLLNFKTTSRGTSHFNKLVKIIFRKLIPESSYL